MIISPSLITAELLPPIGRSIGNSPPPGIRGAPRMPGGKPKGEFSNGGSGEDHFGYNRFLWWLGRLSLLRSDKCRGRKESRSTRRDRWVSNSETKNSNNTQYEIRFINK